MSLRYTVYGVPAYAGLAERVAARYLDALEVADPYRTLYASEPSYKDYVERKKKKGEKPLSQDDWASRVLGESAKETKPKLSLSEKLKAVSANAKKFLSNAPAEVKKFLSDDKHRSKVISDAKDYVKKLPGKVVENAKHAIKHEVEEFKEAASGIKTVLTGGKMTPKQKKAIKTVALHCAVSVAVSAVSGGLAAGAAGLTAKSAGVFASALGKKVALNTVTHGLGKAVDLEEGYHLGHGLLHNITHGLHHVTAAKGKKVDDRQLMFEYISYLVQKELDDLSPDDIAAALEDAATEAA